MLYRAKLVNFNRFQFIRKLKTVCCFLTTKKTALQKPGG